MLVLEGFLVFIELFNFSFFSITGWGVNLDYCDIEWFALEMNRDYFVIFENAFKYCISYSFVDCEGYSISSQGFLSTVVDIMVIQVYAPTSNAEEAEVERFYEDLQDLLELIPKKGVLFIIGDWNAKVGSQETPGVTGKFGLGVQNDAGQRLTEFFQENALIIANTLFQQHRRRLYTWTSPDGQHQTQIDSILCSQRWRSSMQSAKTRPGVDCGSDHELLIAKFRLKLKKVGKTTRPFRYDLHQIPYNNTVEVTNIFKG